MKKQVRIVSAILLILIALVSVSNVVLATQPVDGALTTLGKNEANTSVISFGQKIVPIVRAIGVIAAVLILMVVGIKYMMGSAEEKAEYKKTIPAYIIGAILVFAAAQIIGFIIEIANTSFTK